MVHPEMREPLAVGQEGLLLIHGANVMQGYLGRPDLTREQLERTRELMNANVRDCVVECYQSLIPGLELPDPDDAPGPALAGGATADGLRFAGLDLGGDATGARFLECELADCDLDGVTFAKGQENNAVMIKELFSVEDAVNCLAVTPDGKKLAAGGNDRVVRIYDLAAGYANAKLDQQFENHVIQVAIMSRTVKLSPLGVLVSLLIGVQLFGLLGALLAIPAAGIVHVIAA